ncbi:HlyD family secretion protein [Massilia antarctica]|uniref:HlyD family secretion protein n=1 Tax=Massilia antarctica TaxID=2765360 RepID=UPI0006BB5825|nr:HlyD family efflux transporter periplasmic adaptor subunit [Massilia sp. H27-R4]MCY0915232.1 HlyD family efflux transporter periplasmic adaptor subunit [Massilia sp. H27-R4]CUI05713.1 HlyD family secretion protein [Janthinobacterium sp. CG23_2]CUU29499.1 HlyD family secretion protein [Janthinobacterium sp. CG23_2]
MTTSPGAKSFIRKEVLDHMRQRRLSGPVIPRALTHRWITLIFAALALAIVAFVIVFEYARKAHVSGSLQPGEGLIQLQALQAGVVSEVKVKEGQAVQAGDILFVLSNERVNATKGSAARNISAIIEHRHGSLVAEEGLLQQQLEQTQASLASKGEDLRQELQRVERQIALQQQRLALAERALDKARDLANMKYLSDSWLQNKEADRIEQETKMLELQRLKQTVGRSLTDNAAQEREARLRATRDKSAIGRDIGRVEQDLNDNEAQRTQLVRAARAGMVSAITAHPGQTVLANQTLANFSPSGSPLQAVLQVPSSAIGFIKPGMEVQIRYRAYPYQRFGQFAGQVDRVSFTALQPGPQTAAEGLYLVYVNLKTQHVSASREERPLRPGMQLDATVILEKRKLYEWVLDPVRKS